MSALVESVLVFQSSDIYHGEANEGQTRCHASDRWTIPALRTLAWALAEGFRPCRRCFAGTTDGA